MVNFGLLTAEICWRVWGSPANFNGFRVLAALLHGTLAVGVSQTAVLNRGRLVYSAGRPSRWALAHISSYYYVFTAVYLMVFCRRWSLRMEKGFWDWVILVHAAWEFPPESWRCIQRWAEFPRSSVFQLSLMLALIMRYCLRVYHCLREFPRIIRGREIDPLVF